MVGVSTRKAAKTNSFRASGGRSNANNFRLAANNFRLSANDFRLAAKVCRTGNCSPYPGNCSPYPGNSSPTPAFFSLPPGKGLAFAGHGFHKNTNTRLLSCRQSTTEATSKAVLIIFLTLRTTFRLCVVLFPLSAELDGAYSMPWPVGRNRTG